MRLSDNLRDEHGLRAARDAQAYRGAAHRRHAGDRRLLHDDALRTRRRDAFHRRLQSGRRQTLLRLGERQRRHVGNCQPPARDRDHHRLSVPQLRPGARTLREDHVGRALALALERRSLEVTVLDPRDRGARAEADHVRHGRLVASARQQPPREQTADHEQQEQEEPEPPVTLRRRAGRLGDLLLGCSGRRKKLPDRLVDARRPAATARTVDPVEPLELALRRQRGETIARLGDAVEGRGNVGRKLSTRSH